ncbi:MAG: hypothetical protein Q7V19_11540 [Bacteroidales bacterium]|nr:hypothetical protein [Bacteroidales bacterium]
MRKTIFIILSCILLNQGFLIAQENISEFRNAKIGLTYSSFGENDVFRFNELDGAASYNSDYFRTFGISYVHPLNKWLEVESGIEYSRHHIIIQPNLPPIICAFPRKESFSLINIPVTLRAGFLKYFFVNGGLFLDVDASVNSPIANQTGIGVLLGLGVKYDFDFGISVFVNPYSKLHSLLAFQTEKHHQRILENGFRIGLSYDLRKLK